MSGNPPRDASYRQSGVDLGRMDELKDRIRGLAASTHGPEVIEGGSSFAGLFSDWAARTGRSSSRARTGWAPRLKIAAQLGTLRVHRPRPGHAERQRHPDARAPDRFSSWTTWPSATSIAQVAGFADARHCVGVPGGPVRADRGRDGADAAGVRRRRVGPGRLRGRRASSRQQLAGARAR